MAQYSPLSKLGFAAMMILLMSAALLMLEFQLPLPKLDYYKENSVVQKDVTSETTNVVNNAMPLLSVKTLETMEEEEEEPSQQQYQRQMMPATRTSVTDTRTTRTRSKAYSSNSKAWLEGSRLSNRVDDDSDFVLRQILSVEEAPLTTALSHVTERSICHPNGQFRKPSSSVPWNVTNETLVEEWSFRLTYLAIHAWHHAPALEEAKLRKTYNEDDDNGISNYDYECLDTKFLVTSMKRTGGMGASYRMGAVAAILMGISTHRVTLFYNNVLVANHTHRSSLKSALGEALWLASCPRLDMQCTFLPTTPCTLTLETLSNDTWELPENHARAARRRGFIPDQIYNDHRYLYTPSRLGHVPDKGAMDRVRRTLHGIAKNLVHKQQVKEDEMAPDKKGVLEAALKNMLKSESEIQEQERLEGMGLHSYKKRNSMVHHATLMYLMRLQKDTQQTVQDQVQRILESSQGVNPQYTIGLPIRGSDKCNRESTCLAFDTYMELAHETFEDDFEFSLRDDKSKTRVIVTTEASDIANASQQYNASSNFSLVLNVNDTLQDTGRPLEFRNQADHIMESTLVALQLQMHARYTLGNCCSNFHVLLFDLLQRGCGVSHQHQEVCLQETKNPKYHVCCEWTKTKECTQRRLDNT